MPFLFKDYTDCVLKDYEEKRNANLLSQLLMHPTAANIKQECINVYTERHKKGEQVEENTLRAFFGILPDGKNFGNLIGKCSPDRFRPIQNLIRQEVKNPSSANVELLAWLINFHPRPLSRAEKLLVNTHETASPADQLTVTNQPQVLNNPSPVGPGNIPVEGNENHNDSSPKNPEKNLQNRKLKIAASIGLVMVVLFGGMYIRRQQSLGKTPYGITTTNCMYWAGDHYEPVPCTEKGKGFLFHLDEEKMKSFRKITRKDTITEWSVGKIYYIQNNKEIECYTEAGDYPKDPSRKLRILSQRMFDKYLAKQTTAASDSLARPESKLTN